ncbi:MAG: hypothetical protein U1D99_04755, partial [Candidatus Omnitrophota bacterium]|nr:hypothetical protein [Candidatus Omnitrophota bacterium]
GGEEVFFLDLNKNPSEVFVYSYETDGTEVKFRSWKDYLQEIEKSLQEIREDERAMAERKKNKKWWQFWI